MLICSSTNALSDFFLTAVIGKGIKGRVKGEQYHGVIAQLVERVLSMHEALGSTPSNSIFYY
jgi:hypothetical protein